MSINMLTILQPLKMQTISNNKNIWMNSTTTPSSGLWIKFRTQFKCVDWTTFGFFYCCVLLCRLFMSVFIYNFSRKDDPLFLILVLLFFCLILCVWKKRFEHLLISNLHSETSLNSVWLIINDTLSPRDVKRNTYR